MPLTDKGEKIMSSMKSQYGPEKGEEVFYASKNAGRITGVDDAVEVEGKDAPKEKEVQTKETQPSGDLPSQLAESQQTLQQLEREEEQAKEGLERQNAIEDTKSQIRGLKDEIRRVSKEALKSDASELEKLERREDEARIMKECDAVADAIAARLDALEAKRAAIAR